MEKKILEKFVNDGLSMREIAEELKKGQTTIRYWLLKYELSTKRKLTNDDKINKFCPRCKNVKDRSEFYNRRGKIGSSVYCKTCTTDQTLERMRLLKQKCVEYKGGKCEKCGYDKYNGALDFHHIDPNEKDFTISHVKAYSFDDKIKKELDKCILVCSNCHREIHREEYRI
jgi:predicted HNH restriction endonuclease